MQDTNGMVSANKGLKRRTGSSQRGGVVPEAKREGRLGNGGRLFCEDEEVEGLSTSLTEAFPPTSACKSHLVSMALKLAGVQSGEPLLPSLSAGGRGNAGAPCVGKLL